MQYHLAFLLTKKSWWAGYPKRCRRIGVCEIGFKQLVTSLPVLLRLIRSTFLEGRYRTRVFCGRETECLRIRPFLGIFEDGVVPNNAFLKGTNTSLPLCEVVVVCNICDLKEEV